MTDPKFKVAICGGGVGGLTLAVALSKYPDIEVEVFEAAKKYTEVGAGVGIWSRAFKVLRKLGPSIERALLNATTCQQTEEFVPSLSYRQSDQPKGEEIFRLITKGELMRFHRADFHDGTLSSCDVLVGADGIKSAVRGYMMREVAQSLNGEAAASALACIDPVWSGVVAYRTLINAEKLRACEPNHPTLRDPTVYMGKDANFITYPISKGKFINFAGFSLSAELVRTCYQADTSGRRTFEGEWVRELSKDEIRQQFQGFEEATKPVLECIDKGTLWAVHNVKHLPTHYYGRVALVGDAAHAMLPFQGSGAGQSIEDAYLLATVLGHSLTGLENISRAMAVYDKLRRPFSGDVALRSRSNGQLSAGQLEDVAPANFGEIMTKNWEWAWLSNLDGALEDAVKMLDAEASS